MLPLLLLVLVFGLLVGDTGVRTCALTPSSTALIVLTCRLGNSENSTLSERVMRRQYECTKGTEVGLAAGWSELCSLLRSERDLER